MLGEAERFGKKEMERDGQKAVIAFLVPNIGMLQEEAYSTVCLHIDLAEFFPPQKQGNLHTAVYKSSW